MCETKHFTRRKRNSTFIYFCDLRIYFTVVQGSFVLCYCVSGFVGLSMVNRNADFDGGSFSTGQEVVVVKEGRKQVVVGQDIDHYLAINSFIGCFSGWMVANKLTEKVVPVVLKQTPEIDRTLINKDFQKFFRIL